MSAYREPLRDPRWQRLRLEVMQRDNFACVLCEATDKTLNVHHSYYAKGRKPWEYESESLRTLCEDCHARVSQYMDELKRIAGALDDGLLKTLLGFARGLAALDAVADGRVVPVEDFGIASGLGSLFCLHYMKVWENASARGGKIDIDTLREWGLKNWVTIRRDGDK